MVPLPDRSVLRAVTGATAIAFAAAGNRMVKHEPLPGALATVSAPLRPHLNGSAAGQIRSTGRNRRNRNRIRRRREQDGKTRAFARGARDRDRALVSPDNSADRRKPEPASHELG